MNIPHKPRFAVGDIIVCAILLVCLLWTASLRATVIEWIGFEELVSQSALIFRGEAVSSEVQRQGDMVYTIVRFDVSETLKGDVTDNQVALRFVGGSAGDLTVAVEGQFIPTVGDQGVYFVATTQQALVNPLSGWHQGFFPLLDNEQGETYLDMRQRPDFIIPGLGDDPLISKMKTLGFSAEEIEARFPQALMFSWDDFRTAIVSEMAGPTQGGKTL